jgi:hypothetical protein
MTTWVENAAQPIIVGLMAGCIVLSIVKLFELTVPTWHGEYLVLFCTLVAIEAAYTHRLHGTRLLYARGTLQFRLAELAILFILLQLSVDISEGALPFHDGVPRIDAAGLFFFIVVFCCWWTATETAMDLDAIGEDPGHNADYMPPPERLARRFFSGGILLFCAAGLDQATTLHRFSSQAPSVSGPIVNVLLYFILGMVMLAQIQYRGLGRRWRKEGAILPAAFTGRWLRYSLIFLTLVALLAFLLPTSYTAGFLQLGNIVLGGVLGAFELAFFLVAYAIGWVVSLLPFHQSHVSPHPQPPVHHYPPAHQQSSPPDWLGILRSLLFWLVSLSAAVYLVRSFLHQTGFTARLPRPLRLVSSIIDRLWTALWRRLRGYAQSLTRTVPEEDRPGPRQTAMPRRVRWWQVGRLSPRERLIYYFVNIVRRAERQGISRGPAESALEFEAQVSPRLVEARDDLHQLTGSYLEARYSEHAVDDDLAGAARRHWKLVRGALRRLRG